METSRYVVNVEVAVTRGEEFLLARRAEAEDHASGTLSLVGGTVEGLTDADDALERTARRELREEVGAEVADLHYVESKAFVADDGEQCVDVVFVGRSRAGSPDPRVREPDELSEVGWFSVEDVTTHPDAPPWTRRSVERAAERRDELGW